jgi:hypothetical protein
MVGYNTAADVLNPVGVAEVSREGDHKEEGGYAGKGVNGD